MFFALIGLAVIALFIIYGYLLYKLDCDPWMAYYEKYGKPVSHLKGKVVFITGASSGIGEHTATILARNGVKLVLAARRVSELERVKKICLEQSNGTLTDKDVLVVQMDMLDFTSHQKCFDAAVEHFGHVDVLFNNAGRSQRAQWESIDMSIHKEMFDLNVFSVVSLSQIAIHHFKTRRQGHVAVTSSITGIMGCSLSATYTASKHALHGYFNCLRTEKLGTDLALTVTILCPGPTFTNFLQESFTDTPGEKYGVHTRATDRRMTGERCGELCAVALANKVDEAWLMFYPLLPLAYMWVYFPLVRDLALRIFGVNALFRWRDSKDPTIEVKKSE